MADFQWDGDDADSVILPHQPRTAVYTGRAGNVIVRQEADAMEDYDPQLMFTSQGALATAWAMIEQAHLIGIPQQSSSLMPLDEHGKPEPLDPGVAAMAKRPVPASQEKPALLAAMEAAE
jgi:hypothetical protein